MARSPKASKPTQNPDQVILTTSQFDEIRRLVYENSIDEIEEICTSGEDDMKTIGFTLGGVYTELKRTFTRLDEILDQVDPTYTAITFVEEDEDSDF
jgi:hypothetical protein